MKKLFLVALAAGMFVACGNKTNEEATTDSIVEETVEVVEEPAAPVAEEPVVAENNTPSKNEIAEDIKAGAEATATVTEAVSDAVKENKKTTSSRGNR